VVQEAVVMVAQDAEEPIETQDAAHQTPAAVVVVVDLQVLLILQAELVDQEWSS